MKRAASNFTLQRFGQGFYFGPHPSKSHDYTTPMLFKTAPETAPASGKGVLLLCLVYVGKNKIFNTSQWTEGKLVLEPEFDSVWGIPTPDNMRPRHKPQDHVINFAERVVYNSNACLANYVVFYNFEKRQSL
jgi:hypothetical protein